MATQPIDTAKVYALTAADACAVTITQGKKSITWEALTEGGQTSFLVPAGATVEVSDPTAMLTPLPATFKHALGTSGASVGGESFMEATLDGSTASVKLRHAKWVRIPADATSCVLTPYMAKKHPCSMQLLFCPNEDLEQGWLRCSTSIPIRWIYGEPLLIAGHTYLFGMTQIDAERILVNLLATY